MKTPEQLEAALKVKESDLVEVRKKLADLQVWIDSGFEMQNTNFVVSVFSEKSELKERETNLQIQVTFLKWVLE